MDVLHRVRMILSEKCSLLSKLLSQRSYSDLVTKMHPTSVDAASNSQPEFSELPDNLRSRIKARCIVHLRYKALPFNDFLSELDNT